MNNENNLKASLFSVLTYEKDALGKEDNEQRWILCTNVVTLRAPVAIG